MRFPSPLVPARLIRRYKRFLADVELERGGEVTVHCPNPGAMTGLAEPGTRVWVEPSRDPKRKLGWGWRLVDHGDGHFTGIDTGLPNRALRTVLEAGAVPGLEGYETLRAEVPYAEGSRVDFLLEAAGRPPAWVEVKSVTLCRQPGLAEFPDSVTARGAKHLGALSLMAGQGARAVLLYLVQRTDCTRFAVSGDIDPAYARAAEAAKAAGVEVVVLDCAISPEGVDVRRALDTE